MTTRSRCMGPAGRRLFAAVATLLTSAPPVVLAAAARTQDPLAFARAVIASAAPAQDDPDARARDLLTAVATFPGAPYAHVLLSGVLGEFDELQDPAALLPSVQGLLARDDLHGDLRRTAGWLCFRALQAAGRAGEAAAVDPMSGAPDSVLCVGPFGDDGDDFAGVPFPPELLPWRAGITFEGRTGPVAPRAERRGIGTMRIDPAGPQDRHRGCHYTLHRVTVDAEVQCYLSLWCQGALQAFVDGVEVGRFDPALDDGRAAHRVPIAFAPGENQVLIKSCSKERLTFELDYVDARGLRPAGVREVAAEAPFSPCAAAVAAVLPPWRETHEPLLREARTAAPADHDTLLVAAGLIADVLGQVDLPLQVVEEVKAPGDPATALALARLWRRIAVVPEEQQNSRARALEEPAIAALPAEHFAALRSAVGLLEEKDQREDALRLLWRAVDQGHAGPATFRLLLGVAERARFAPERPRILARWLAALPRDAEAKTLLARDLQEKGATARAKELAVAAVQLRPDLRDNLARAFYLALDAGDAATARALCERTMPVELSTPSGRLSRDLWEAVTRFADADRAAWAEFCTGMLRHPDVDGRRLKQYADLFATRGLDAEAIALYRRCLELVPDDDKAQRTLAKLAAAPPPDAAFARFRRDGDAAIAGFVKGDREDMAPATQLIDQMLVEVLPDGSQRIEVHQLLRINDPSGVEAHKQADDPAHADELVLLRTVDAAGNGYVPVRIQDSYAMPHLEPGAFVEWVYRDRNPAPEDGICRLPQFTFQSLDANTALAEFVVITAADTRLEVRTRNLQVEPEVQDLGDGRTARRWQIVDQPRLLPENFLPPAAELVPVVAGGVDGAIAAALRAGSHRLAGSSRPTPPILGKAEELTRGLTEPLAKYRALDLFCQGEITSARTGSATETLLRQKGHRQLLLTALLRAAGFTLEAARCESVRADFVEGDGALFADPTRFYDEDCVRVTAPDMPPMWLFYDAPRWFPPTLMSAQHGTAGVVVATAGGTELQRLPPSGMHMQDIAVRGEGRIVDDRLEIEVTLLMGGEDGYAAAEHFDRQPTNAQRQFARQFLPRIFTGWQIRDASLLPFEAGKPLSLRGKLQRRALQPEGDRLLLPVPMPQSQFLAGFGDRPGRKTPLRLTMDLHLAWDLRIELGAHALTRLPAPVVLEHGPLTYLQEARVDRGALVLRRRATMGAGTILPAQLGDWLAALQQVERAESVTFELLTRQ